MFVSMFNQNQNQMKNKNTIPPTFLDLVGQIFDRFLIVSSALFFAFNFARLIFNF